jgi:heme-degrading monooxygenase HmoA
MVALVTLPLAPWAQSKNKSNMENKIVIGRIYVPKNSIEEFRKQAGVTPSFLKTLPGFIKNEVFEKFDDTGNLHFITIVIWQDQQSFMNAQQALTEYYKKINFDRMQFRDRLKITADYEVYSKQENQP